MSKSNKPIKSNDRDESGEYYWICPKCGNRVGGYIITGRSFNDWGYKEDKFCSECGIKINWNKLN